jgi:hypothetical protein
VSKCTCTTCIRVLVVLSEVSRCIFISVIYAVTLEIALIRYCCDRLGHASH